MIGIICLLKKYRLLILLFLLMVISLLSVLEVRAQTDLVSELLTRLTKLGIPVKSIIVDSRLPFQITITLQSITPGDHRTEEDWWNEILTGRETALSHKFGLNLDSYTLILVNQQGDTVDWSQTSLNLSDYALPYRQFYSGNRTLDDSATATLLKQELDFADMTLDDLNVSTGLGSEQDVQIISIRLSAVSLQDANRSIPDIIGSIRFGLDKVNQESDYSRVALCHLWVMDANGNELLDYIYDVQLGTQSWGMAPGVLKDWFPHPYESPTPTPIRSTSTPVSYPEPLQPTQAAYPYP